jgi:hypothetical protein
MSSTASLPRILTGMRTRHTIAAAVVATMAIASAHAVVFAHEVTHNGTVVALQTAKYAQPSGGAREVVELEVAVVDPKTKKPSSRVFTISDKTRILRAGKPVTVAGASARKGEKVAVVVDHDKPGDEAIEVRFEAAQEIKARIHQRTTAPLNMFKPQENAILPSLPA